MKTVAVTTDSKKYDVFIGKDATRHLPEFLHNHFQNCSKLFILTDETVAKLHLASLTELLADFSYETYVVPSGEKAKTFDVYYDCLTFALTQNFDRKSIVLALGGGAVGDLAGFVAATFMRGIPFIQIPTTILAHDSAVGGKVAINHPEGKNMIGAFYQPEAVFYNTSAIATLPDKEIKSGFAEVIKHALINDENFYSTLLKLDDLSKVTEQELADFLQKGIEIKAKIVGEDEKETGIRAYLNFGHTLGHAIEAEMGYGNMTHGEAVAIGMIFALTLSKKKYGLDFSVADFSKWLEKLNYQIQIPNHLDLDRLINRMKQDKKSVNGDIHFVLLQKIGQPQVVKIAEEEIKEELQLFKERM
ncbi:3-dehydroquinate synthase [Niallia nealsonii]|uniref:3-dehydroquinate synthase n=1 Tax=Niallia nealsonii TaxID=115979 RepID=UPI0018785313|nr:3-dehydroquinate synthase [Niallia nealsonii]